MTQKDLPWIKSYPPEVSFDVDTRPFENLNDLFEYGCQLNPELIKFLQTLKFDIKS